MAKNATTDANRNRQQLKDWYVRMYYLVWASSRRPKRQNIEHSWQSSSLAMGEKMTGE